MRNGPSCMGNTAREYRSGKTGLVPRGRQSYGLCPLLFDRRGALVVVPGVYAGCIGNIPYLPRLPTIKIQNIVSRL